MLYGRKNTKEARLKMQQAEFDYLISKGWLREDYKGLKIFTIKTEKTFDLKVFWGTATNHTDYLAFRTEERRAEKIQERKESYDRHEQFKQEQKSKGGSSQASAAKLIKAELQEAFPGIKFSVTSDSFSMGDSVDIRWTDGPTTKEVDAISGKYQYGHFDGMTDMYEHTNSRDDIPQSKYVHSSRTKSEAINALLPEMKKFMPEDNGGYWHDQPDQVLYRIFARTSFPAEAVITGIERRSTTGGSWEDNFIITYTAPTQEQKPQITPPEAPKIDDDDIKVIEYGKGIAVLGEKTREIKDKLGRNGLGGIFQPRLSCGPGWIFPKSKLDDVVKVITEFANSKQNV